MYLLTSSLKRVGIETLGSVSTEELVNTSCPLQASGHVRPSRSSLLQSTETPGGLKAQPRPASTGLLRQHTALHPACLAQDGRSATTAAGGLTALGALGLSLLVISAKKLAPDTLCLEVTGVPPQDLSTA